MQAVQSVVVGGQSFNVGADRSYAQFWTLMRSGGWENDTMAFIARSCGPRSVLYDIGAWIGPISLLAGTRGTKVYAIEPDPVAVAALRRNVAHNAFDITVINKAVSSRSGGSLTLYVKGAAGDSETSAVPRGSAEKIEVETMVLYDLPKHADLRKIVKIDIEGYEYALRDQVTAFCRDAEALQMSFHPRQLETRRTAFGETSRFIGDLATLFGLSAWQRVRHQAKAFRCCFLRRRIKNFHIIFEKQAVRAP